MAKQLKVIVEKHSDGYVAYPLGLKGVVVGEGDTTTLRSPTSDPRSSSTSTVSARKLWNLAST